MIEAVASANQNTIVLLETGNPTAMPCATACRVSFKPGIRGRPAAWRSQRCSPARSIHQAGCQSLSRPILRRHHAPVPPGLGAPWGTPTTIRYDEGAEVGYRWFAQKGGKPLYAFGHGLSYTSFAYRDLEVYGGETVTTAFTVTNTGSREGANVPQVYLTEASGDKRMRLLGFERVVLKPSKSKRVTVTADPRLLARFDSNAGRWRIAAGTSRVALGRIGPDRHKKPTRNWLGGCSGPEGRMRR